MPYKHKFITIEDVWFDEKVNLNGVDRVIYHQVKEKRKNSTPFHTMIIDLTQTEEEIFQNFTKSTRKTINSALKKGLIYKRYMGVFDENILNQYIEAEEKFADEKGLSRFPNTTYKYHFQNKKLMISTLSTEDGNILTWHIRYINDERARALRAVSFLSIGDEERKKLTSLANRLHHWEDMKFFKSEGYKIYDFGGWYAGSEDKKKLTINQFKQGFNGSIEMRHNAEECLTWKCRLFDVLAKVKNIIKK